MSTNTREKSIARVSVVGVVSNALLGVVKIIVGIATGSVAIITDAANNLTDTSSSIITIIGTHLAGRRPDRGHPFGYGRVEYLTSLVIGLIVFFTGVELCRTSVMSIIHPHEVKMSVVAIIILVATVFVKIFLGSYTLKAGRRLDSGALVASGMDARSDAVATTATLVSAVLALWKGIYIDAWVGALISLYIVWTGFSILRDTVSKMLGEPASEDVAKHIHDIVCSDPNVKGTYDLILNSYGPNFFIGSANVEVDCRLTAEEIYRTFHRLQQKIYDELHTIVILGLYAVDDDTDAHRRVAGALAEFIDKHKDVLGFHGLFVDEEAHSVYVDIMADYDVDTSSISYDVSSIIKNILPDYTPAVTIDTPFAKY